MSIQKILSDNKVYVNIDETLNFKEVRDIVFSYFCNKTNPIQYLDQLNKVVGELFEYFRKLDISKYELDSNTINEYSEILKDTSYTMDDRYIYYSSFIECSMVIVNNSGKLLNDYQIDFLKEMNYGITNFKIFKRSNGLINSVICDGIHPNKNPYTNEFCLPAEVRNVKISKESLEFVKTILSTINLHDCYNMQQHLPIIKGIING